MSAAPPPPPPRVSVVIRSYNRLPTLCRALEALLAQDHDAFEVVVVEQSTRTTPADQARLEALAGDPRVRLLRHPPLGGARARNTGVAAARGALVAFLDDDDLPEGPGYLAALERCFDDPQVVGVTVRHRFRPGDRPSPLYRFFARRRALRFSPLLAMPLGWARHDQPIARVDYVHGTGAAIRRELIERAGGWDEDTPVEDEASFAWRARPLLRPGERFAFDPRATVLRDLDVPGGLDKRRQPARAYFRRHATFVRNILGRYSPRRVRLLAPLYALTLAAWTAVWWLSDRRPPRPPLADPPPIA